MFLKIEKLRLCRNISLDSHSIALMQLPCLQSLHIDDMSTLQDWQLAGLIKTTKSLTSIRLHEVRTLIYLEHFDTIRMPY